jgi:tetratricopeptide (TPR) repeat protein
MNIENVLNKAELLYKENDYSSAIGLCLKLLKKKPKLIRAQLVLALSYKCENDFNHAINAFEVLLDINPLNTNVLQHIGQVYMSNLNYKSASTYFKKVLEIDGSCGTVYNNLALCEQNLGDFSSSSHNFKKAIEFEPESAKFYQNIGRLYLDAGFFDASLVYFMKSFELDPIQTGIYFELLTLNMYMHRYEDALEIADIGLLSNHLSDVELCELLVSKAILFWLFDNLPEALQAIELSNMSVFSVESDYANIHNLGAFHTYLSELINYKILNPILYQHEINRPIYFISESHGLSPAGIKVIENDEEYIIKPLFIKGAKVFHLTDKKSNKYLESLKLIFRGLDFGAKVILGFGEIDCRNNEGIFKYCKSSKLSYRIIIEGMINEYLSFLNTQSKIKSYQLYIYGVPAPHVDRINELRIEDQKTFINIISCFNSIMEKGSVKYGFKFLDVYKHTNKNGDSNMDYHIDGIHLAPPVMSGLFKSMS